MRRPPPSIAARAVLLAIALAGVTSSAVAQHASSSPNWREVKCARYAKAWVEALARLGKGGLSQDFIDRHATFLASGCTGRHDVCPRSTEEFAMANVMVIQSMNAGTASTFAPFACPR